MHGNAQQWCADSIEYDYYGRSPVEDPAGPDVKTAPILRGGCWFFGPCHARSAFRSHYVPVFRCNFIGFRVARTQ
jgi:formylglycine-generating enzyme